MFVDLYLTAFLSPLSGPVFLIPLVACMVGLAAILLLVLCITTRRYKSKDSTTSEQQHLAGYFSKTRNNWIRKRREKHLCRKDRNNLSKSTKNCSPTELTDLEPGPSGSCSAPTSPSPEPGEVQDIDISDNRILAGVRDAWRRQHDVEVSLQKPDVVSVDLHSDSNCGGGFVA